MAWLGHGRYHPELEAETARLAWVVAGADPSRPVPTCPAWTLAELAAHVGEWLVRRTSTVVAWEHRHGAADVAVSGPALDLLLVLYRRAAPADTALEVAGDERLLSHWLAHSAFEG